MTEVRVRLVSKDWGRLKAHANVVFDGVFLVRDFKVVEGDSGPFVVTPSRPLSEKCPHCGERNSVVAAFCNMCGKGLPPGGVPYSRGVRKEWVDVAHPVSSTFRVEMEEEIIRAYRLEVERVRMHGEHNREEG